MRLTCDFCMIRKQLSKTVHYLTTTRAMNTSGKLIDVDPEELNAFLDRAQLEQITQLAILGPATRPPSNPDRWPVWLRGKIVYRLQGEVGRVIARIARLTQLRALVIRSLGIDQEGVRAIAEGLPELTSLDIGFNKIGEGGARAIAERLLQLTSLNIGFNDIGEAGARAIAERLPQLTSLNIGSNNIGEGGARAIAEGLPQLTSLNIGFNDIGKGGARTIAEGLSQLTSLDIRNNDIGEEGARAIAEGLSQLTSLDIRNNDIGEEGARAIAEGLSQLTSLDVASNDIGEGGARAIAERLPELTSLNIGFNDIGDGGARVIAERLPQLTSLVVWSSSIGEGGTGAIAERLLQLTSLNIGFNDIGEGGARAIAERLLHLTSLDIGFNKIGEGGARAIAEGLSQLRSLDIGFNDIGEAGARAIAERLLHLTSLDIGFNDIGEAGARAIAERLPQLTSLNIGSNNIGEGGARAIAEGLPQLRSLDIGRNKIGDWGARTIAEGLSQLTFLDIGDNKIGEVGVRAIVEGLPQLTSLDVGGNDIGDGGARVIAEGLSDLTSLDIGNNAIGDEGARAIAEGLTQLRRLRVSQNKGIRDVAPLATLLALRELELQETSVSELSAFEHRITAGLPVIWAESRGSYGLFVGSCPLETPPVEIASQGPDAVRNYFLERQRQGVVRLYESKVLIIGQGGAGKTTLLRRLYQPDLPMPGEDESTRGIYIHRQDFVGNQDGPFRLNVWDFGGQQIYHATHQFFLTKSSLYVLVDDTRKDDKSIHDESFKFWLEVVETLSDKCPILIFQNEKGGRSKALDLPTIKGRFPNVREVYAGNLDYPHAADTLREAIQFHVQQLPHVGNELPAGWLAVRQVIEAEANTRPFISQDEYFAIYGRYLEFDRTKALHLSRYLHDLGVFLHFQDDLLLKKMVILQNQWATDAVFRVLDDEATKKNLGRFTRADCSRLWHEAKYADMHAELLGLMQKFELCYQLADAQPQRWLSPQLLPPSKPGPLQSWAQPTDLVVRFRYSFLPRGLVNRLMVRQHRFAKQLDRAWGHGAFFEHRGTEVLVEETLRGSEIELRARGAERKELLSVLSGELEALNDSFEGLRGKVEKLVPCICHVCSQTTDPEMYRQAELVDRRSHGKQTIECRREPYEYVNVLKLLDGIEVSHLPDWALPSREPVTLKIFLASSAELRADRDEFELYFRQQNDRRRKQGVYLEIIRWEHFLDAMSATRLQDAYNHEIRACDIFVCLVQTKAGKFTEEEFDVAFEQFHNTGKPRIYTYFKGGTFELGKVTAADLSSLESFQHKLTNLGHYYTPYMNTGELKHHFSDQLDRLTE